MRRGKTRTLYGLARAQMTSTAASVLPRISSRYALWLIIDLACGGAIAGILLLLNPELGVFAVMMLANVAGVSLAGAYFAVQSIRKREPLRWLGYAFMALLLAAIIWAAVDM